MDANQRRLLLERQRQKLEAQIKQDFEKSSKIDVSMSKFVPKSDDKDRKLAAETVGLVELDQFQKIKETTLLGRTESVKEGSEMNVKGLTSKLSFTLDDDEEEGQEINISPFGKRIKIGPNPSAIITAEQYSNELKIEAEIKKIEQDAKLLADQESIKKQLIKVNCSFWDGVDHRFLVEARKGSTVREILEKAQQLYPPLRSQLVSSLLLVKENVILPHDMSVFDLLSRRHKNKFIFEFLEDTNNVFMDSSKNCKIITKSWYEHNKHTYPAKDWIHHKE